MIYLIWCLPFLVVAILIGSGRAGAGIAGVVGILVALGVATTCAPIHFRLAEALSAIGEGLWLSFLVGFVIAAGIFFRELIGNDSASEGVADRQRDRRRWLFAICFLIGPFAESVTGFGVGQITAISLLRGLEIAPLHVALLGLFSQVLVPWGAMANPTIVGAQLANISAIDLGVHTALLSTVLLVAWVPIYWRLAKSAGVGGSSLDKAKEIGWLMAIGTGLVVANRLFGPEIATIVALGPMIVFAVWLAGWPARKLWSRGWHIGLPYAALAIGLALSRSAPALTHGLTAAASYRPFVHGPAFVPLLHPGVWLVAVALVTAITMGQAYRVPVAFHRTWQLGKATVTTIAIYLVLSQIMATSGVAAGLASAMSVALGTSAILATPLISGTFGLMIGSGNATNGLLMPSQTALAAANGVDPVWVASIQNTTACALTMLSPARVGIGCALAGAPGGENEVYRWAWPLGLIALLTLFGATAVLLITTIVSL